MQRFSFNLLISKNVKTIIKSFINNSNRSNINMFRKNHMNNMNNKCDL